MGKHLIFLCFFILLYNRLVTLEFRENEHFITINLTTRAKTKEKVPVIIPLSEIFGEDFDYSLISLNSISLIGEKGTLFPLKILPVSHSSCRIQDDDFPGNDEMLFSISFLSNNTQKVHVIYSEKGKEQRDAFPIEKFFETAYSVISSFNPSFENKYLMNCWRKKDPKEELQIEICRDEAFVGQRCLAFKTEKELSSYCGVESKKFNLDKSIPYSFHIWIKTEGIDMNKDDRNVEVILALQYQDKQGFHHDNLYKKYVYYSHNWRHLSIEIPPIDEIQSRENVGISSGMEREYTGNAWIKIFMRGGRKGKVYFDNMLLIPRIDIVISQLEDIVNYKNWNLSVRDDILNKLLFYERNYLYKVYPHTSPRFHEVQKLINGLDIKAACGEFEPTSFAIYSIDEEKLRKIRIKVSDLRSKNASIIEKSYIDLRYARSWIQGVDGFRYKRTELTPEILDKVDKKGLYLLPNESVWIWVTVLIPKNKEPGRYYGSITVETDGYIKNIPFMAKIYTFQLLTLEEAGKTAGIFYQHFQGNQMHHFIDIRNHGFNSISIGSWENRYPKLSISFISKSINEKLDFSIMNAFMRNYRTAGFSLPLVYILYGVEKRLKDAFDEYSPGIFSSWGDLQPASGFYPDSIKPKHKSEYYYFRKSYVSIMRRICKYAKKERWPDLYFFPIDEPFSHPNRMACTKEYLQLLKKAGNDLITFETVAYDHSREKQFSRDIKKYLDIYCIHVSSINTATIREKKEKNRELWFYFPTSYEEPELMRYIGGCYFWKTGASGLMYWKYLRPYGNLFDDTDSEFKDACLVYPAKWDFEGKGVLPYPLFNDTVGPLPTIQWEGAREGLDDARYLLTLQSLVEKKGLYEDEAREIFEYIDSHVFLDGSPYTNPSLFGRDLGCIGQYQVLREEIAHILEKIVGGGDEED